MQKHISLMTLLVDLNVLPDEEIYRHKTLAFLEIVQKHIFTRDLEDIADHIIKLIKRVKPDHDLFNQLIYYMLVKGETANVNQVIEKLKTIEDYEEDIMNAAQQLKQQSSGRSV
ncbi:Rpn family recombination-promoting nuclease/putative transposase [Rickettsiella grylli]|uniref:Rpn family recombination-promoting nuclease/putative transposase n=1 Tax=Rickettsiella grylli TaxID=59196 RepID=UPI001F11F6E9|nr:Rpn family recombination-promoting nuclease/putative transposase [Rickettsiella grylli]